MIIAIMITLVLINLLFYYANKWVRELDGRCIGCGVTLSLDEEIIDGICVQCVEVL